jgi:predicted lipoprotein
VFVHPKATPKPVRLLLLFVLTAALVYSAGCTLATTRPLDPTTGKAIIGNESQQFNAANYVASIWDTQVIPALDAAPDFNMVLTALKANTTSASETYGRKVGQQPYTFVVAGSGVIISVNTESRAGLALVDTNYDGTADVSLAVGPVIRGTAMRDGMSFISFNQFTNQMEFASVSNEMNALINQQVIAPLGDLAALVGKDVSFAGAFTFSTLDDIVIAPGRLTVSES